MEEIAEKLGKYAEEYNKAFANRDWDKALKILDKALRYVEGASQAFIAKKDYASANELTILMGILRSWQDMVTLQIENEKKFDEIVSKLNSLEERVKALEKELTELD